MAWVSAGPCMRLVAFATRRHPPAAAILAKSSADPSFDPLSTIGGHHEGHYRLAPLRIGPADDGGGPDAGWRSSASSTSRG